MPGLFLGLSPDSGARAALVRLNAAGDLPDGRQVAADNLHLTLRYLGQLPETAVACLGLTLSRIDLGAFELVLDCWGVYRRAGVLWAGCRLPPPELLALAAACDTAAVICGAMPLDHPFNPHCTLRRKVRNGLTEGAITPIRWPVAAFHLYCSESAPGGVRYRSLREFTLAAR
ncbi:MAG: RNA 2',3'-cyclic phosphodiesterase [Thiotrichales bacterium]